MPDELRPWLGYDVLVADTVNHALRGVRLADGHVTTVAGTGEQYMVGAADNFLPVDDDDEPDEEPAFEPVIGEPGDEVAAFASSLSLTPDDDRAEARGRHAQPATSFVPGPRRQKLSSPWDVAWSQPLGAFVVAMAGNHTLWAFDDKQGSIELLGGTMNEGLLDGPLARGLVRAAVRAGRGRRTTGSGWPTPRPPRCAGWTRWRGPCTPSSARGCSTSGTATDPPHEARLQHPLGVAVLPDGSVVVADTYNGAVRRYADGGAGEVTTLATDLAEPSGIVVLDGGSTLLVVESAAHRLTRIALPATLVGRLLDSGAHRTQRPVTELSPGEVRLDVVFTPGRRAEVRRPLRPVHPAAGLLDPARPAARRRRRRRPPRPGAAPRPGRAGRASCTSPRTRPAATPTPRSSTRPAT